MHDAATCPWCLVAWFAMQDMSKAVERTNAKDGGTTKQHITVVQGEYIHNPCAYPPYVET